MLFALKYGLPFFPVPAAAQLLIILLVATGLAWHFWWNCSPDRRGVTLLIALLWVAGLIKLVRL